MAEFSRRFASVSCCLLHMFSPVVLAQAPTPAAGSAASTASASKGDGGSSSGRSTDARTQIEDGATAQVEFAPLLLFDGELKLKTPRGAEHGVVRSQNPQRPSAGAVEAKTSADAHESESPSRK